ncbi:hypothetical protein Tco_1399478, partial [Tanacetum coccineum]
MVIITRSLYVAGDSDSSMGYKNDNDVILGKNTRRNGKISDGANDAYKVFDEMSGIKFIKQDGSVLEYYDEFISYHNAYISWTKKIGQSEESLASLFMSGLEPEIEKMVYFRPKTLHSAYLLANLQEATNELIRKKSNATTPMSSSLKINLSKEREKVNSALVGYHECCKANEKSEEIECMGLTSLEDICEENVEGADMELDVNNGLVVIDKVCNIAGKGNDLKSNESSEMEVNWVVRVDPMKVEDENKSVMSVDEFVDNDARMTIGDGVTTNKMVEIKMGMDGFCKESDKGIKMWITKCMRNNEDVVYVHKNVVEGKGAVEEESFFSYQNTVIVHGRKENELKYMRLQEELKCRRGIEQRGKKMASNKDKIDSSKRYETSNLNKLTKVEEQYNGKQDGSKEGNNFVGSDFVLGKNKEGSWWLYHIKDPCEALAYGAMNLGTNLLESIFMKPQTCWCAACLQKGNKCLVIINEPCVSKECGKVKTTTPLKFDKKLAGFDVKIDDVFVEAFVTKIPYSEGVIRKFKKVELLDQCTVECLGGMERETCDKMRNSVKKDGSGVHEMEFIGGDIIREEGFEEDRKNGNNSFSNIVGKKKEYCVEQNERTKGNDNFVVWDSRLLDKTDYPSAISDCLATLKSEEILVKSGWKKFVFEGSANGYGTYSNSSKAQHVVGEGRGGVKLNMWWPRRKNKRVMFDIWKWPKRIKEVIGCLGKKELVHYWKVNSLCSLP